MPAYICVTCGTQHAESDDPPSACRICTDERQYVGLAGQRWTTLEALAETHEIHLQALESGLWGFETRPGFAIGQRALLVQHPEGNVLWDCLSLVDQAGVDRVADLGGLAAIAISHPHYYGSMVEWSRAFGGVPIYIHDADARWVCRPDPAVAFWAGETCPLADGITLICCGGHFEGGTILHWAGGADRRGALLTGDIVKVGWDRASVSVMRSYPNLIPVGPSTIRRIETRLAAIPYDRIYGAWTGHEIAADARAVVGRSLRRYLSAIAE
jgi:glyoxylase-like metal-dependent hydrolase (beta-lactamase superfamily II)